MRDKQSVADFIRAFYPSEKSIGIFHHGISGPALYVTLKEAGYLNYLGIASEAGDFQEGPDIYIEDNPEIIRRNNGEVLILEKAEGQHVRHALNSSASLVLFKPKYLFGYVNILALLAYKLGRRKKWAFQFKRLSYNGKTQLVVVLKRAHKMQKMTRHYLSPALKVEDFFRALNENGLSYVVLRWFDEIPFESLEEDIDLLVADHDIASVQQLLNERVGVVPVDIYSVSGLEGSNYEGMAYYPPYLAESILENPRIWKNTFPVPNHKQHFLSLLYHAVYHKGEKSGFSAAEGEMPAINGLDHDYPTRLYELSLINGTELEQLDLPFLHRFLEQQGWAPATDTLRKLSIRNEWLKSLEQAHEAQFPKKGELMVFVIREWAMEYNRADFMLEWFEKAGLDIITAVCLDEKQQKKAAQNLRGGNWSKGIGAVSGGDPAILAIVYDYHPKPLTKKQRGKYPHVSNAHYLLKEELRAEINARLPANERTNPIHSSDDETEALDYIHAVVPELMTQVRQTIEKWDRDYETAMPVLQDLSENRRRAKVEVVEFNGRKAVKKTYKAGKERFLEREKFVYGVLSKECPFIPPLLDSGPNYIITPFYKTKKWAGSENKLKKLVLKMRFRKDILSITEFFYKKGYALIDFHPGNLLITDEGLKVIDFEFLYEYEKVPENSSESYDLLGFPEDFPEDRPYGIEGKQRAEMWRKILY